MLPGSLLMEAQQPPKITCLIFPVNIVYGFRKKGDLHALFALYIGHYPTSLSPY
jgi:hypothetical protein